MIAVDWAHTKQLVTFDGDKLRKETRAALLKRLSDNVGESDKQIQSKGTFNPALELGAEESDKLVQSNKLFNSAPKLEGESRLYFQSEQQINPSDNLVVLETGCPLSFIYDLTRVGYTIQLIKGQDIKEYRESKGIAKSDEADARCIYELASANPNLLSKPITPTSREVQIIDSYRRFYKLQKARVILENQSKAFYRYFGSSEDTGAMDIALNTLEAAEHSYLQRVENYIPQMPARLHRIKGMGERLWAGIMVTADPTNFPTLSRYLRFCGLVDRKQLEHKFNRHARALYYLLADGIVKARDPKFLSLIHI